LGLGPIPLRCKLILSGSQLDHLFAKLLLDGRGGVSKVHRSPAHEGQKGHREAEAPVQASCLAWLRTRDHRNVSSSEHSASPGSAAASNSGTINGVPEVIDTSPLRIDGKAVASSGSSGRTASLEFPAAGVPRAAFMIREARLPEFSNKP
jgi:hypothetical protein